MILLKSCTQYARKFGKLSSDHRAGKCQFSVQSQRKAMPKNIQTTAQLHSSHMLAQYFSKFSKLDIDTWELPNVQAGFRKGRRTRDQVSNIHWIIDKAREIQRKHLLLLHWASLIAQLVKNLPAVQETPVRFLGQEDPLEKEQATHSSILGFPLWLSW